MSNTATQVTATSILVHRQGGLSVPIAMKDASGAVVNISGKTLTFVTESGLNVPLVADPANAQGKLIKLTVAQVQSLAAGETTEFALVDSTGAVPVVLWGGVMQVTGF